VSVSESEFFAMGMSLPPDVRKRAALRLLESVDPDEAFAVATEEWLRTEAVAVYDALKAAGAPPAWTPESPSSFMSCGVQSRPAGL
jgi:hypothetical protein